MLTGLLPESVNDHALHRGAAQLVAWPTLLVVDTDLQVTGSVVCFFERRGFHVAAATSLAEAKPFLHRRKNWTLIISDYHLPDGTGVEFFDWIREQGCESPVLLTSGSPHFSALCGEIAFLPKPFSLEKLESYVRDLKHRH